MRPISLWSTAFLAGALFGTGLILSGMSQPAKVLGFLDLAGLWDPSLAFVMVGAIATALPAFAWAKRRRRTLGGALLELPARKALDSRLFLGSALFGIGWGLSGLCPGPAVVSIGFVSGPGIAFCIALWLGQKIPTGNQP